MVTYHSTLPSLYSTTRCHLPILHASEWLQRVFPLPPLIVFRCLRNLRASLVWAALISTPQQPPGNYVCGAPTCKISPILSATDEFSRYILLQVLQRDLSNYMQEVWPTVCRRDRTTTTVGSTATNTTSHIKGLRNLMWSSTIAAKCTHRWTWVSWWLTNYGTMTHVYAQ